MVSEQGEGSAPGSAGQNPIIRQIAEYVQRLTQIGYVAGNVSEIAVQNIYHLHGEQALVALKYLHNLLDDTTADRQKYVPLAAKIFPSSEDDPDALLSLILLDVPPPDPVDDGERAEAIPSVLDAPKRWERFALLGEPGAGKTATLHALLSDAAQNYLSDPAAHPLPLYLELGNWPDDSPTLEAFVKKRLRDGAGLHHAPLDDLLLLLDGLNEISAQNREQRIQSIRSFMDHYSSKVIIACRKRDYIAYQWDSLLDLPYATIERLDDARIRDFLAKYLSAGRQARAFWRRLSPGKAGNRPALVELARNPYLLSMLLLLYQSKPGLPSTVADLFERLLAQSWLHEARRHDRAGKSIHRVRGLTFDQFVRALCDLAYTMIDQNQGASMDLAWVHECLQSGAGARGDALLLLAESCSILILGDQVRFYQQLMQEYFAARALDWRPSVPVVILDASDLLTMPWREALVIRAEMGPHEYSTVLAAFAAVLNDFDHVLQDLCDPARPEAEAPDNAYPMRPLDPDADSAWTGWAWEDIRRNLSNQIPSVRAVVARTLGEIGGVGAVRPLAQALLVPDPWVHRAILAALKQIGDGVVVAAAVDLLREGDSRLNVGITAALQQVEDGTAFGPLIEALANPDAQLRRAVATQLGEIAAASAVPALIGALADPDPAVGEAARRALELIGTPEALAALGKQGET